MAVLAPDSTIQPSALTGSPIGELVKGIEGQQIEDALLGADWTPKVEARLRRKYVCRVATEPQCMSAD